jgi:hypothetical protein
MPNEGLEQHYEKVGLKCYYGLVPCSWDWRKACSPKCAFEVFAEVRMQVVSLLSVVGKMRRRHY